MELIMQKLVTSFDMRNVRRGHLLWAKHYSWTEGKAGFVTAVTESQLMVQYYPGIGNVTNHFRIPVSEVAAGQWKIRWSDDMSEIHRYEIDADNEASKEGQPNEDGKHELTKNPEVTENLEAGKGRELNDSGRIDL